MAVYCAIRWMADDGAIRWMADDVRGNRRRWGSGVPPARRGWCRGESRHATLRFAYRVTEECRRSATRECKPRDDVYTTALRRFFRLWRCIAPLGQSDDDGGRWVRQPPKVGKWRTSGTQRLVSRRIPARYAALCIPGYGRVPSLCDERVQTEG